MNKDKFIVKVKELGINLTEEQIKQFEIYCEYLLEENKKTNLTAIKEEDQVYLKHFYDSLTFIKSLNCKKINTLLDIGTGAGFPGMVLKIAFPEVKVTLLDSNNKKIKFLENLKNKLNIQGIELIHNRAEELVKTHREYYDVVTARAVTNLPALAELALPLTKKDGYFIAMKGSNSEEIASGKDAIEILGGNIEEIETFILPLEESIRNIIKIKKINTTPKIYPRRYEKILKYPLKKNIK